MTDRKKRKGINRRDAMLGVIFVSLPLVAWLFFEGFPLIISFVAQFGNIDGADITSFRWNDFSSFRFVFADGQSNFWKAFGITLWVGSAQFVSLAISLGFALLLHKKRPGSKFFELAVFLPYICSSVAVAIMWRWMFNEDSGIVNSILVSVFGEGAKVRWFSDEKAYTWMLFIISVWKDPGYGIVMYKAALKNINGALYEAAAIDGANEWQKFRYITLNEISSTTFYLLMTGIIAGLKSFEVARIVSPLDFNGTAGPDNAGLTLVYYIYLQGVTWKNMSVASVMSWILFAITFVISFVNIKMKNRTAAD